MDQKPMKTLLCSICYCCYAIVPQIMVRCILFTKVFCTIPTAVLQRPEPSQINTRTGNGHKFKSDVSSMDGSKLYAKSKQDMNCAYMHLSKQVTETRFLE